MLTLSNILFLVAIASFLVVLIEWYKTKNRNLLPLVIYFGIYILLDIVYRVVNNYIPTSIGWHWVLLGVKDIFVILILFKVLPILIPRMAKQHTEQNGIQHKE